MKRLGRMLQEDRSGVYMYKKEIPETAATTTSEEEAPAGFRGNVAVLTPWFWSLVFRVIRQFMPVVLSCPICWLQLP